MPFRDRAEAGRRLGQRLAEMGLADPLVLGLPRGGIPVAKMVAETLGSPFDVFVARKIGFPRHEELGIGAIAEELDEPVFSKAADSMGVDRRVVESLAVREQAELQRRVALYRGDRPIPVVSGRTVVLVDDGLATGVTAEAALQSLRKREPARLLLAVPVCAPETAGRLSRVVDQLVALETPPNFVAVGEWYDDFRQVTDEEVIELLSHRGKAGS
jgi:putative phosphoribosyl transferase